MFAALKSQVELSGLAAQGVRLVHADAREVLRALLELPRCDAPHVVYLDPMHPARRRKSSLVKQHMRDIRELVGADEDADELLELGRRVALERVVVKRPSHSQPLGPHVNFSLDGRTTRFDCYLPYLPRRP